MNITKRIYTFICILQRVIYISFPLTAQSLYFSLIFYIPCSLFLFRFYLPLLFALKSDIMVEIYLSFYLYIYKYFFSIYIIYKSMFKHLFLSLAARISKSVPGSPSIPKLKLLSFFFPQTKRGTRAILISYKLSTGAKQLTEHRQTVRN